MFVSGRTALLHNSTTAPLGGFISALSTLSNLALIRILQCSNPGEEGHRSADTKGRCNKKHCRRRKAANAKKVQGSCKKLIMPWQTCILIYWYFTGYWAHRKNAEERPPQVNGIKHSLSVFTYCLLSLSSQGRWWVAHSPFLQARFLHLNASCSFLHLLFKCFAALSCPTILSRVQRSPPASPNWSLLLWEGGPFPYRNPQHNRIPLSLKQFLLRCCQQFSDSYFRHQTTWKFWLAIQLG